MASQNKSPPLAPRAMARRRKLLVLPEKVALKKKKQFLKSVLPITATT